MAINTLVFANALIYTNKFNEFDEGMVQYNDDQVYTARFKNISEFSCTPTATERVITLFTYADGKKIRMHYTLGNEGIVYTLTHYYDMVDANNNLIDWPTSIAHNNPTLPVTDGEYWDPTQPGFDTFPFSQCYYVSSVVDYYIQGTETLVNDPAQFIFPAGQIFWKHSRPPVGGYSPIGGTIDLPTLGGSYGSRYIGIVNLTDDTNYAGYFNVVDPDNTWHGAGELPDAPDPSGPGGGDRPSDDGGDAVDFPDLPGTSVINTGLITLFNPDNTTLRSLAGVLWGNDFEQSIKKVLNDPFDGLIGLSMVPFTPTTSGSVNCEIGNFDTEVLMPLVSAQYYTINCGTVTVKENWGNALDYNATSAEIFVPFVGFCHLDIQDVMGRTLALKYNVDILTGAAIAILKCGDKCLYEWPCNVAYNIPLTGSNKAALYTGLISVALSGLGGLAAGGVMGAVGGAATSAINVATHAQSNVQRGGSLASNTGVLGEILPYLVLHRPKQSMPQNFKGIKGYQSNITSVLGNCQGYTEVDYIHLQGLDMATDTELQEIETLLKSGVII